MYYVFLDGVQMPIPPKDIKLKVKNKNKTDNVIGIGEINIIKPAGLTDIEFELLLPNSYYPFNQSIFRRFRRASYYLKKIKKLKIQNEPFRLIIVRMKEDGEMLHNTNINVTLEDYNITESYELGYDCSVRISLKQYKEYHAKKIRVEEGENGEKIGKIEETQRSSKSAPKEFTSNGDSLLSQLKKQTGRGDLIFKVAKLNKIAIPMAVAVGEVIRLE